MALPPALKVCPRDRLDTWLPDTSRRIVDLSRHTCIQQIPVRILMKGKLFRNHIYIANPMTVYHVCSDSILLHLSGFKLSSSTHRGIRTGQESKLNLIKLNTANTISFCLKRDFRNVSTGQKEFRINHIRYFFKQAWKNKYSMRQ